MHTGRNPSRVTGPGAPALANNAGRDRISLGLVNAPSVTETAPSRYKTRREFVESRRGNAAPRNVAAVRGQRRATRRAIAPVRVEPARSAYASGDAARHRRA